MTTSSTYYVGRTCAINYIHQKTNKLKDTRANIWLADELEELVANPKYSFIVLDDEDVEWISSWNKLNKESLLLITNE